MGGWWRLALVSTDGVMPSWMVTVSASVNLPLHHKVQKFSSGTGSPGWSRKKGRKTVVVWWWCGFLVNGLLHSMSKVCVKYSRLTACVLQCFDAVGYWLFVCFRRSFTLHIVKSETLNGQHVGC